MMSSVHLVISIGGVSSSLFMMSSESTWDVLCPLSSKQTLRASCRTVMTLTPLAFSLSVMSSMCLASSSISSGIEGGRLSMSELLKTYPGKVVCICEACVSEPTLVRPAQRYTLLVRRAELRVTEVSWDWTLAPLLFRTDP